MNAAIPETLREFVLARVAAGGYPSVDDYVSELLQADRERFSQERLEEELARGLSTERVTVTPGDFDRLRQEVGARHADAGRASRR